MDPVIGEIRRELEVSSDEVTKKGFSRFFKEDVRCYGVKAPAVGRIARKYWKVVRSREKQQIFSLCEELYQSGYCEEAFVVSAWAYSLRDQFKPGDLVTFRSWIDRYITNWAACDGFCNHAIGSFMEKFPEYIVELQDWAGSDNRWVRRAAAVSLIVPAKQGKFANEALNIALLLLTDEDDMVRKGYGWLLKEVSRKHQDDVFRFVIEHRKVMPRTALRYAIELMPKGLKAEAMKKDW